MKKRSIVSIDQNTGEILEGVIVYYPSKSNPYSTGWFMTSQDALELLAGDEEISKEGFRILMFMMSRLDFENWIYITQKEISEKTKIKKSNVSRGISLLEKKEIILRGPKIGRSNSFRLNPYFGWKGKVKNLEKYREEKYKNEEYGNKICVNNNKSNKRDKISKFSEEIEEFSRKYDIPLEKAEEILNGIGFLPQK